MLGMDYCSVFVQVGKLSLKRGGTSSHILVSRAKPQPTGVLANWSGQEEWVMCQEHATENCANENC